MLGIDSDNGSEFINNHLLRYCQQEKITFTRGRAGKKNDGCFVEQKNYSVVRRAVGYARYDSPAQQRLLNTLYAQLRLYTNYFQPVMKLVSKERIGAKVKKTYDLPQTPYRRLLESWLPTIQPVTVNRTISPASATSSILHNASSNRSACAGSSTFFASPRNFASTSASDIGFL